MLWCVGLCTCSFTYNDVRSVKKVPDKLALSYHRPEPTSLNFGAGSADAALPSLPV